MSHKTAKLGVTSLVLAVAFGTLLYSSIGESAEYYKHVDEVMVNPAHWQGKKLQLHGFAHRIARKPDTLEYRFTVENKGKTMTAFYTGAVPDAFKEDSEVVLKGTLASDGSFQVGPDGVVAKCPSKYEPQPGVGNARPIDANLAN